MRKEKRRSNAISSGAQADADHHDSQPFFTTLLFFKCWMPSSSSVSESWMPSSSSVSDLTDKIVTAANEVHREYVDADVDRLIEHIIYLLKEIKVSEKKTEEERDSSTSSERDSTSSSESLKKFKEALSNVFKNGEAKSVIQPLFKDTGTAQFTAIGIGFLIVAHVLETFDTVSTNRHNCLRVLEEICHLAKLIKKLRRWDGLMKEMEGSMKEAMELIVHASIICSTQIGSTNRRRYFKATQNKEELEDVEQSLQRMYRHMDSEITICIYDAMMQLRPQSPKSHEMQVKT